ncbi:MAG: hypothetical protein WC356_01235 [Candidatus Micrarchaeia archaeon]|jgi:ribosomal protein L40E
MKQTFDKVENIETQELLHRYKEKLPPGFKENLSELSWGTIANLAMEFQMKIKDESKELRKIHKEISLTNLILSEKLKQASKKEEESVELDAAFLRNLIALLGKSYKISIQYEVDLEEFMIILSLIIEKLKKEKLLVYDLEGKSFGLIDGKIKPKEFGKERALEDNNKYLKCPECGATNPASAKKCAECGCEFKK